MRTIGWIAVNAFRESVRDKVLYNLVLFAILMMGASYLLGQLTDAQLQDLFEVSRVTLRLRAPLKVKSGFATVDEWVNAFKQKREQITDRRCA